MTRFPPSLRAVAAACLAAGAVAACGEVDDVRRNDPGERRGPTERGVSRTATVESSVLLLPLAKNAGDVVDRPPGIAVEVKATNSGDALAALCAGAVEVALANRRMSGPEREVCDENGLRPVRSLVAHQVVAVYRHPGLDISCLTAEQLRRLWRSGSRVERYRDLAPGLPSRPVRLIAYPPESAAFELFAGRLTDPGRPLRKDVVTVADRLRFDRVVRSTAGSLAFGPYGLAALGDERLGVVKVDGGRGCAAPSPDEVQAGRYNSLSSPLFMYSTRQSLEEAPVKRFVDYVLDDPGEVASYPGVVPPDDAERPEAEPRP